MRTWYRIQNAADNPAVAEIHIIDVIAGWDEDRFARNWDLDLGVTARAFVEELGKLPATTNTIHLHINSPGGDVQAGINIANALREQQMSKGRTVETFIDGIAASIASVIAMAGSKVHISDNALVLVHNPYSWAVGNAADMRKAADFLDTMRGQIVNTYKWHSTLGDDAIIALMDAESWFDADAAVANGFATDKITGLKAAASLLDSRALAKLTVPDKFKARVDALRKPEPPAPVAAAALEVVRACNVAGCAELAETLIAEAATTEQVTARLATAKQQKQQATARATEITALCTAAKVPQLAAGYVAGAMAIADVRVHLATITALKDTTEIDTGLGAGDGPTVSASWKRAFDKAKSRWGSSQ